MREAQVSGQEQPVPNEAWFKKSDSSLSVLPAFLPVLGAEHPKLNGQKWICSDQRWQAMLQAFWNLSSALLTRGEPKPANYRQLRRKAEDDKRWQSRGSSCPPLPAPSRFTSHTSCCSASPRALPASSRFSRTGSQCPVATYLATASPHSPFPGGLSAPGSRHPDVPLAATCPISQTERDQAGWR